MVFRAGIAGACAVFRLSLAGAARATKQTSPLRR
jgi:hypothetical protein